MKYQPAIRRNVEVWSMRQYQKSLSGYDNLPGMRKYPNHGGVRAFPRYRPSLRVGIVSDVHFSDRRSRGLNHYQQSEGKLHEAADFFRRQKTDFVVELGDLIDGRSGKQREVEQLQKVQKGFEKSGCDRHFVMGNHCLESLTKKEFGEATKSPGGPYSFDAKGWHFAILDANFRKDGAAYGEGNFRFHDAGLPQSQLDWLRDDLGRSGLPTAVFVHQRLDTPAFHPFGVREAQRVRQVLEKAGNVAAVFQGHSHFNAHRRINGVHYTTMVAMVKGSGPANNGYAVLELYPDGTAMVQGFRRQRTYHLAPSTNFL